MHIMVDAIATEYMDLGGDTRAHTVLFLHGWGAPVSLYAPILSHLAQTHRVLAPNMPGVGQTPEPEAPWDAADYVRFVLSFCRALALRDVTLIGHSHGGRVILKLMNSADNTLSVDKIVLMDSAGLTPHRPVSYYIKVYSYKASKAILRPFPALRKRWQAKAGSADYRAASPVMRGTLSRLVAEDMRPLLPAIKTPTLLLWGEKDDATPLSHAKEMETALPDAGLVVFPGGGHYAPLEHLPVCLRVLDSFLGGGA